MLPDLQYAAIRFENFVGEVLLPAAMPQRVPLQVGVWQTDERNAIADAARRTYAPVELGWRWGPVWSTAWFRLTGRVPASMIGARVALRFSCGTEALLWKGGVPQQGFDPYRDLAVLHERATSEAPVDLLIEAACNLPLGVSTFWWDHPEVHARWKEAKPGRLEHAELVALDEAVWRFAQGFDCLRKVLLTLPETSARAHEIDRGLRALMAKLPMDGASALSTACTGLFPELAALVMGRGPQTPVVCNAVGHAHIDTAWLWPLAETQRKCLRTFANVLRLQERFPRMHFLCSQAQQYAWVEQLAPALFAEIKARVHEGRWEPGGAMWIEPDCTCPSGESFVRQVLHGTRYWQSRFGDDAPQRFLYLPDTFGFPASLPQIMAQAGLDTFITNKMSWCESNRFPNVTFRWRGIDGTEVLTHLTPGHNYNSSIEPKDFQYAVDNLAQQDGARVPHYLQPYGFGDGGGGPTAEQIERANIGARCEGLPRVEQTRVDAFCETLHAAQRALQGAGQDVHVWDGELYLELHRGTYTSQAWIKQANRRAELDLRAAEVLACAHAALAEGESPARAERVRSELDNAWKTVLLNQFHDILPGSSIAAVYDDAREQFADVQRTVSRVAVRELGWLTGGATDASGGRGLVVFNPASSAQTGVVQAPGGPVWMRAVPSLGVRVVRAGTATPAPAVPARVRDGRTLCNEHLSATIDDEGRIASLRRTHDGRAANRMGAMRAPQPMNQLMLYRDQPRRWEAWDVDRDYAEGAVPVQGRAERVAVTQDGPLVAEITVERRVGKASRMVQRYRLVAGCPRLDIETEVDWRDNQTLLRASFPCAVRARCATFGIQYGCIERATHTNTSWDRAQFEVPGHNWMDLSEPGLGVAVLDDGKFGRSAKHGVLGLSLLRAPNFPDPGADRGHHRFTYSVMAHDGDWRAAGVDAQADQLNNPLRACAGDGAVPDGWQALGVRVAGTAHMDVSAVKPSEDAGAIIARLVEVRGGSGDVEVTWGWPVQHVAAVDLLERPMTEAQGAPALSHDPATRTTRIAVRPFQIVTLAARHGGRCEEAPRTMVAPSTAGPRR